MPIPTKFTTGDTIEEKLVAIETTLRHFSRRLQKTGTVLIPPIPIFARSDVSGVVFRGLIPYKGQVNSAAIFIGRHTQRPATVTFTLSNPKGKVSISVVCDRQHTTRDLGLELSEPSVLEIVADGAEEILVGVLTQIELSKTYKEMMLLDAILSNYELAEELEEKSE